MTPDSLSSVSRASRRRTLALAGALAASLLASACVPLAITGITAGAMAAADRRTLGAQTDDQAIELKATSLISEKLPAAKGVSTTSYNRKVLLTGQAPDAASKARVQEMIAALPNVRGIQNEIVIGPRASMGTISSDAALTARVRAAFIGERDLPSEAFKVVTEAGVVYLMGLVTRAEADRASQIASRVSGVTRVVTVFEYLPG